MYYVFRGSRKKGYEQWGHLSIHGVNYKGRKQIATNIHVLKQEWTEYCSDHYLPTAVMASLNIKYGAFNQILFQMKNLLEQENDARRIEEILESAHKTITKFQISQECPGIKEQDYNLSFTELMKKYIDEMQSGERINRKTLKKFSQKHIRCLYSALKKLVTYEHERKTKLMLSDITMSFRSDLITWLKERGLKHNTITYYLYAVRRIMQMAFEQKLTDNKDFLMKGFFLKPEEVNNVFLSPNQIEEMENLDISTKDKLKDLLMKSSMDKTQKYNLITFRFNSTYNGLVKARDLFLLGYYTGQRYSDYSRINKSMITEYGGVEFIKIIQKKTKKKVLIPLDRRVLPILERYGGSAPKIEYSCFNDRIKTLGELLHWTWKPYFDNSDTEKNKNKRFCDMICTHTARRSFATNAYAAGVPIESIMAITGHETEESFRTYIKLQSKDKAKIADRDFNEYINK